MFQGSKGVKTEQCVCVCVWHATGGDECSQPCDWPQGIILLYKTHISWTDRRVSHVQVCTLFSPQQVPTNMWSQRHVQIILINPWILREELSCS